MFDDFFVIVSPCWSTICGSRGSASFTRFCTSTAAMSRSVPISKVTVMRHDPSLADCDWK